jgi:hypothetical protein
MKAGIWRIRRQRRSGWRSLSMADGRRRRGEIANILVQSVKKKKKKSLQRNDGRNISIRRGAYLSGRIAENVAAK